MRHILVSMLIGIGVLAGLSVHGTASDGSTPGDAIENAAVAPYVDLAHKEAKSLCEDFVPAVAAKLVWPVSAGRGCAEAAAEAFARSDVLVPRPGPTAIVRTVYPRLNRAWVELLFGPGETLRVQLRRAAGRWRVSSDASLLPTCPESATTCRPGSNALWLVTSESSEVTFIPEALRGRGGRELHEYEAASRIAAQSGCLACHRIGEDGNRGPGSNLTHVGARLDDREVRHALVDPRAPMPSFKNLPRAQLAALNHFLALLK